MKIKVINKHLALQYYEKGSPCMIANPYELGKHKLLTGSEG